MKSNGMIFGELPCVGGNDVLMRVECSRFNLFWLVATQRGSTEVMAACNWDEDIGIAFEESV